MLFTKFSQLIYSGVTFVTPGYKSDTTIYQAGKLCEQQFLISELNSIRIESETTDFRMKMKTESTDFSTGTKKSDVRKVFTPDI